MNKDIREYNYNEIMNLRDVIEGVVRTFGGNIKDCVVDEPKTNGVLNLNRAITITFERDECDYEWVYPLNAFPCPASILEEIIKNLKH